MSEQAHRDFRRFAPGCRECTNIVVMKILVAPTHPFAHGSLPARAETFACVLLSRPGGQHERIARIAAVVQSPALVEYGFQICGDLDGNPLARLGLAHIQGHVADVGPPEVEDVSLPLAGEQRQHHPELNARVERGLEAVELLVGDQPVSRLRLGSLHIPEDVVREHIPEADGLNEGR